MTCLQLGSKTENMTSNTEWLHKLCLHTITKPSVCLIKKVTIIAIGAIIWTCTSSAAFRLYRSIFVNYLAFAYWTRCTSRPSTAYSCIKKRENSSYKSFKNIEKNNKQDGLWHCSVNCKWLYNLKVCINVFTIYLISLNYVRILHDEDPQPSQHLDLV